MSTAVAGVGAGYVLAMGSAAILLSSWLSNLECGKGIARIAETERWRGRAGRVVLRWLADADLALLAQLAAGRSETTLPIEGILVYDATLTRQSADSIKIE